MDVRSWKKSLLQWITECNFMERNYFNIEQTNIDVFFRNFCLKHKVASEFDTLKSFLETHYPEFQPHFDDENALSTADYIYIYSLLLHFCCVKCPDEHFHGICQKLPEQAQQCIAVFFKHLLECPIIDKKNLRGAITEVADACMSSPPVQQNKNESIISSASSSSAGAISVELQASFASSPLRLNGDSSQRTPNRKAVPVGQRVSPSTPKSFLLEERTRELYNYKAQLETERYEKGLLELQIMQNEQQIFTLNQVQKTLQQKIQSLKDEILNQSVEPNRHQDEDDQLQKRLYRQINEREDEIYRLNDRIRNLDEEKTLLENKLRHAEKKLIDYRETIQELELKLNELAIELEKKESTIKCLTDDKAELEHFVTESRAASCNSRHNSSADLLDSSFIRFTNTSSSLGSPENLGVSVVDVHLREKEHENAQLRDELDEMRASNMKLAVNIKEKLHWYQTEHSFDIINAAEIQDEEDPATDFESFVACMFHLSQSYKDAKVHIQQLEDNVCSLKTNNNDLEACINDCKQEIERLTENLNNSENKNETYKHEIENLEKLKNELARNYETTVYNFEAQLKESEITKEQQTSYIEGLNEKIRLQMSKIETLIESASKLQTDKKDLEKKCDDIQAQLKDFETQKQTLQETIELQNSKLQTHIEAEQSVKQRYEQLLIQNDEMLQKSRETNIHMQNMSADIKTKETELSKLGKEIVQLGKNNADLEDRIKKLNQDFNSEMNKRDKELEGLQKSLSDKEKKLQKKSHNLQDIEKEMKAACKEVESLCVVLKVAKKECSPFKQLSEIKDTVYEVLKDKHQLEEDNKQTYKQLQSLEDKLRSEVDSNEKLLCQHKVEIDKMNESLLKSQARIEQFESTIKDLKEAHQEAVLNERKQIEELQEIIKQQYSEQHCLKEKQQEERMNWQSKQEQLKAELNGEKEVQFEKLADAKKKLEKCELQLIELQDTQNETQKNFKETVNVFESKVQSLSNENDQLRIQLNAEREELASKVKELTLHTEKIKATEFELQDHAEKILAYENNIDLISKEKQQLQSELQNEQETVAIKIKELATCTEDYKKTKQQLKMVELQLDELNSNFETAQNNYETAQKGLESHIQELKQTNTELQASVQQLQAKLNAETELRLVQEQENKSCKQELGNIRSDLQALQQKYVASQKDFEEKKSQLEENIKVLTAQNEQYRAEILKLKDDRMVIEEHLLKTEEDLKQSTTELEKAVSMLNERNVKLEQSQHMLTLASEKFEEKTKIWENVQLTYKKQSEELDDLRKKTNQLQETHHKQCAELESLHSTIEKQSNELLAARQEIDNLQKADQSKLDRTKKLETEVEKLQNELTQVESKQKNTIKDNDERVDEVKALSHKLKVLQSEHANLKAKLEQVSNEKTQKIKLLQEAEKIKDDLNAFIKEKDQNVAQVRDLLKETETCLKSVNEECSNLQGEIVAKEAELRMINDELNQVQTNSKIELDNALSNVRNIEEFILDVINILEESLKNCNLTITDSNKAQPLSKACDRPSLVRLKEVVNSVLFAITQQQSALTEIPVLNNRISELNDQQTSLLDKYNEIKTKFKAAQQKIEELENQKILLERVVENERERYSSDSQNLETVNKALCEEIETLQLKFSNKECDLEKLQINYGMLKAVNDRLSKAQESLEAEYSNTIDSLKSEQQRLIETLNEKKSELEKLQQKFIEVQQCAAEKETLFQQNLNAVQSDLEQSNAEKSSLSEKLLAKEEEYIALVSKYEDLESKNAELNTQTVELQKECISLRAELVTLNEKYERVSEEYATSASQLNEANANCITYTEKLANLCAKQQQLERNFKDIEAKLITSNSELDVVMQQKDLLLNEKENLFEEISAKTRECRDLKQTIHNLNQKLALSDLEKDDLRRQLELLRTQVEVNSRYQTTSESKLKNIVETSQALERNLLSSQNALKTSQATLDQFKLNTEKLDADNKKLRDNYEAANKRMEKIALKLGESLARSAKLERENTKLVKASETQAVTIESIQREKDIQLLECKTLRERLNRIERLHEQCASRVQTAEKTNATLIAAKQKLEAAEVDLKSKIGKLENSRQIIEERLRKMTHDYEHCERENVNLNHQIGGLNTEIQMLKNAANDYRNAKLAELNKNLTEVRAHSEELEKLNKKLTGECCDLKEQNQCLTDQLSKVVLGLEISKARSDQLVTEVAQLESELKKLQQEKISMEQGQNNIVEQLENYKRLHEKTLSEKHELEQKIIVYENDIVAKDSEISAVRREVSELRQNAVDNSASLADKATTLVAEIESLRTRLLAGEVMLEKEQENNAKLRSDNQILLAKYREAKQRAESEIDNSEERIKENRLELEGKLEKMKNKMKVLYTEEITKMKAKQERETGNMRSELSILKAQNSKYEEHTRKLSAEIMTLNDRMLEYQKENTYLLTKLKYAQNEDTQFKRPNITNTHTSTSTIPRLSSAQSIPTNIGNDLAMEDEEGEIFNNTYLTDMKNGKMSEIAPEELQHRNSLLPPHLKSAYAVQYDHGLCEDEVKDGHLNGLDDSMSALLSNNSNCIRKKVIGVTHYRKPGPPTPSKNGGRLSFGGSSEPAREILKESYDDNVHASSSVKTPARFTFFSSRFSMGNNNATRDEYEDQQQEQQQQCNYQLQERLKTNARDTNTNKLDLRRELQRKNLEKLNQDGIIEQETYTMKIMTSTPRKSRGRTFDKRRLINEIMKPSVSVADESVSADEITLPEMSVIETPTLNTAQTRRQSRTFAKSNKSKQMHSRSSIKTKTVSTGSSTGAVITALQRRIRRRPRREQGGRPSLCIQKNLYTNKACTPQLGALRALTRIMGRKQRMLRFDKQRLFANISSSTAEVSDTDIEDEEGVEGFHGETIAAVDDGTFDVNKTKNSKTMVIIKNEIENFEKSSSLCCEQYDFEHDFEHIETTSGIEVNENAMNCSSNKTVAPLGTTKTVTTTELNTFNEQLEKLQSEICNENDTCSKHFEQLLKETLSQAPFEIRNIRLSANAGVTQSDSGMTTTTTSSSGDQLSDNYSNAKSVVSSTILTTSKKSTSDNLFTTVAATPHQPSISPSAMLQNSRTIYGASVIFNRRIPNVDGLRVRKSSIYFKNPKCSTFRSSSGLSPIDSHGANTATFSQEGDLILVTNQTITLFDLICMWHQMNVWTRLTIGVILLGSIGAIVILLYIFCFNR